MAIENLKKNLNRKDKNEKENLQLLYYWSFKFGSHISGCVYLSQICNLFRHIISTCGNIAGCSVLQDVVDDFFYHTQLTFLLKIRGQKYLKYQKVVTA